MGLGKTIQTIVFLYSLYKEVKFHLINLIYLINLYLLCIIIIIIGFTSFVHACMGQTMLHSFLKNQGRVRWRLLWNKVFTGRKPFLTPNQQHQSTEGCL